MFDKDRGWLCVALVSREEVLAGVAEKLVEDTKEESRSYTEKLIRQTAKKK